MNPTQTALARKYLIYKLLTNLWFVSAVWLFFYRIFLTDQQVGVLDGVAFSIGLIAEVPSGALADKFGRDRLVRLGHVLSGCGILFQAFSTSLPMFILGQAAMMIGVSFVSGADEALFYENMQFDVNSNSWRKLVTRGSQVALLGTLIATITGGYLHSIDPKVPWILNGLAFVAAAMAVWTVTDNRPKKERQNFWPELQDYLKDIKMGFGEFTSSRLIYYVLFIVAVQGLFYTAGYGLLRLVLLDRFGFDSVGGAVIIAASSLTTVVALAYLHKHASRFSEKRMLISIGLFSVACLLVSVFNIGVWGFLVILLLYLGEHILQPFMSEVLNTRAKEDRRATTLSVASFLKTLPYIFLAPIIGTLNTEGKLEYFLIVWAGVILISVFVYIILSKKDTRVNFDNLST